MTFKCVLAIYNKQKLTLWAQILSPPPPALGENLQNKFIIIQIEQKKVKMDDLGNV